MKILVLGAGAIGGYYGARLLAAGADVRFLVRPNRAASLEKQGLVVRSALGDYGPQSGPPVRVVQKSGLSADFDVVVLTCKAYALDEAMDDIAPAMADGTIVLPFLNGLAPYDALDTRFGRERVAGGVAYIATELLGTGEIAHYGQVDNVVIGARAAAQESKAEAVQALFARSPGSRSYSSNIEQDLWNKWVMIAAGGIVTCLMRGTIGEVMQTTDGRHFISQAIRECEGVARRSGFALPAPVTASIRARLLDAQSTWSASMMRDIAQGAPRLESDAIIGDLVRRAHALGMDAPLARTAVCHLQVYQMQRQR